MKTWGKKEFAVIFSLPLSFWLQIIYIPPTCKTYASPFKVLQNVVLLQKASAQNPGALHLNQMRCD